MPLHISSIPIFLILAILASSFSAAVEKSMDSTQRVIKEIEPRDKQWLQKAEKLGLEVLVYYAGTSDVTPKNLDVAFQKWKSDKTENRAPDQVIASGLGALFGNYIIKHKNCRWVVVTDKLGTELALQSSDGKEIYPFNSVWKRIDPENKDMNFFEPIWTLVVEKEMKSR